MLLQKLKIYLKDSLSLSAALLVIYGFLFIYGWFSNAHYNMHYDLSALQSAFNWVFSLTHGLNFGINSIFNSPRGEQPIKKQ